MSIKKEICREEFDRRKELTVFEIGPGFGGGQKLDDEEQCTRRQEHPQSVHTLETQRLKLQQKKTTVSSTRISVSLRLWSASSN